MKAEERHELRENDLANWLQFGLWAFLKANGSYLLLIAALGFLGYRLWALYEAKKDQAQATAFASLIEAEASADAIRSADDWIKSVSALVELIDKSDVKIVQARACLKLGRIYDLWAAFPEMQDTAKLSRAECLSKSYEYFTKALTIKGDDSLIAALATIGIADVYEDQGEWDKAKAEYQKMIADKTFAGPPAGLAKARLDSLQERRDAPRLAMMIPHATTKPEPAPSTRLSVPGVGSSLGGGTGGGLLGPNTGSPFPSFLLPPGGVGGAGATTSPAMPYGPVLPGASSRMPASAPATEPK